ncbi:hypothetical protein [Psychrobacillus antarcticus]|uniref:hypothetical protein n=1 Tax=Psychrobacillus antarcticus TaxID=2879115 RepID=UPI002407E60F|nr:hypothetical protein [Psychrobacillus antarcticus]
MFGNLFKKKDPIEVFWQYFIDHEKKLYNLKDKDIEKMFRDLYILINKVNNQLIFSTPVALIEGKREFTISASSIGKNFPDVIRLVEAAPKMENFKIIAFEQRNDDQGTTVNDIELTRDQVFFDYTYDQEHTVFCLMLYIKEFNEDNDDYFRVAFDLLEIVIGEYVLGTEITEIQFNKLLANDELIPINDLPKILEDIKNCTN